MQKKSIRSWMPLSVLITSLVALSGCGSSGIAGSSSQKYTIGGLITNLASGEGVGLLDNKSDAITVSADGPFTFATALANGSPYTVTVTDQPTGQTCKVMGGSGKVHSANVTNVAVSCGY